METRFSQVARESSGAARQIENRQHVGGLGESLLDRAPLADISALSLRSLEPVLVVVCRYCRVAIELLFVGVLFDLGFTDIVSRGFPHHHFQPPSAKWKKQIAGSLR